MKKKLVKKIENNRKFYFYYSVGMIIICIVIMLIVPLRPFYFSVGLFSGMFIAIIWYFCDVISSKKNIENNKNEIKTMQLTENEIMEKEEMIKIYENLPEKNAWQYIKSFKWLKKIGEEFFSSFFVNIIEY